MTGAGRLASSVMANTQSLPVGTRIITSIGVFVVGGLGVGTLASLQAGVNLNNNVSVRVIGIETPENNVGNIGSGSSGVNSVSGNNSSSSGNSTSNTSSSNVNNSKDMIIDDSTSTNTFVDSISDAESNLNIGIDSGSEIPNFIYSVVEKELSGLEIIFQNLLNLELIILALSVMILNILIVRYLFKNYKDIILNFLTL